MDKSSKFFKNKKIIAREFLFFMTCVFITLLVFVFTQSYNSYINHKIEKQNVLIQQGEINANKLGEGYIYEKNLELNNVAKPKLQPQDRAKLDATIKQMINGGKKDSEIKATIKSFQNQYGIKPTAPQQSPSDSSNSLPESNGGDPKPKPKLKPQDIAKLDAIVKQMHYDGKKNSEINIVIRSFQDKYAVKQTPKKQKLSIKKYHEDYLEGIKILRNNQTLLHENNTAKASEFNVFMSSLVAFLISFSFLFLFRYIYLAIKWSITTLKS